MSQPDAWPPPGLPTPYYHDPQVALYQGRAEQLLPALAAQSIDLVVTDPPYFRVKSDYAGEKVTWDRQWASEAAYLAWLRALCQQWQRLLRSNGSLYCFASAQMAWAVEGVLRASLRVLSQLVWEKANGNANWKAEKEALRAYLPNTERILFAECWAADAAAQDASGYTEATTALHKRVYAPIATYLQQERERAGKTRDQVDVGLGYVRTKNPERGTELCRRWEEGSSLPTKAAYERYRQFLNNGHTTGYLRQEYEDLRQEYEDLRRPFTLTPTDQWSDVWRFPTVAPGPEKHPCEKPLALLRQILRVSSRPGAVVLDCCAGSGSTLEAAKQLGRRAIGIELEARYCRMAASRLRQETFLFDAKE